MSGFGLDPFGTSDFGTTQAVLPPGYSIPGADYSVPVDHRGGTLGEEIWFRPGRGPEINLSTIIEEQYKEGIAGRWSAPVEHFSQPVPEQDGERYRGSRVVPNQIVIPITLVADSIIELRGKIRQLARALNPKLGIGELNVVTQDGLHRVLHCIPESFEADDPGITGDVYDARVDLTFRAFDPFWQDAQPVSRRWFDVDSTQTFFPLLPVRLGASSIFGIFDEDNAGDDDAWPVWRITGPGTNFKFTNETTGSYSQLSIDIPADRTLVIDTRPGVKMVYFEGSKEQSLWPYLLGSLWPLGPGVNKIRVQLMESNEQTSMRFTYQTRYLGV